MSKVQTIYLIHHSHLDIGYTHDQPVVWEVHERVLDEAIRLAAKYAGSGSDGAFRWTVENTAALCEWLEHAPPDVVERFVALEHAGRIEVTGMLANLTPLADIDEMVESFQAVGTLRKRFALTITTAMQSDVNGQNWPLVDLLLDIGISGFTMSINTDFGGAPQNRPLAFWWQGPSDRKILAYSGWEYGLGLSLGIGQSAERLGKRWPDFDRYLEDIGYPLPIVMVQSFHPFGDNGPAFEGFSSFIDAWNAEGKSPRIILATPRMWWNAVAPYASALPVLRGDWTDYWNFGSISSARETSVARASRARLRAADALAAATLSAETPLPTQQLSRTYARYRAEASKCLCLWNEHTWGAIYSIEGPDLEDSVSGWHHKAHYAWQGRSLSVMLQRDAIADLSRYVARGAKDDLLVYNEVPWPRRMIGEVPQLTAQPRGLPEDATAGRLSQDRTWPPDLFVAAAQSPDGIVTEPRLFIPRVEVPGYGFSVIPRRQLVEVSARAFSEQAVVENAHHRLTFDLSEGGVSSWYDRALNREWIDKGAVYRLNAFVHEEVADAEHPRPRRLLFDLDWAHDPFGQQRGWKPDWRANRRGNRRVLAHRVYHSPFGTHVVQVLEAPGIVGSLVQSTFVPQEDRFVDFQSWWTMGLTEHPEATYLAFPLHIEHAKARVDLGGQAMAPGEDQLPGSCHDYYTVQQWVDLSNEDCGMTLALPGNPMVQLGGFHFGHHQDRFALDAATVLCWVTNNYWATNFLGRQPGGIHVRCRLEPHAGRFCPAAAHRVGLEAAYPHALLQHLGEPAQPERYPSSGQFLRLPESFESSSSVFTLHVKPRRDGQGLAIRLYNGGPTGQVARVGSALLHIVSARLADFMEHPIGPLVTSDGVVSVEVPAGRVTVLLLSVVTADLGGRRAP